MGKHNNDSHKVILGLAVSTAAIGAGILYYLQSTKKRQTPVLNKIGKAMVEIGEMLEDCNLNDCANILEKAKTRTPSSAGDLVSTVMSWASTGINIWKTLNKGR